MVPNVAMTSSTCSTPPKRKNLLNARPSARNENMDAGADPPKRKPHRRPRSAEPAGVQQPATVKRSSALTLNGHPAKRTAQRQTPRRPSRRTTAVPGFKAPSTGDGGIHGDSRPAQDEVETSFDAGPNRDAGSDHPGPVTILYRTLLEPTTKGKSFRPESASPSWVTAGSRALVRSAFTPPSGLVT